jgi:hypothetical protein
MEWLAYVLLGVLATALLLWGVVAQPLWRVAPSTVARVSPTRLRNHVRALSLRLVPRDAQHPEMLERVAEYLEEHLRQAGVPHVWRQTYQADGNAYHNVVADLGPDTRDVLIVGAHHDACGPFPGADDNASAVAVLLEMARCLARQPLKMRVQLVSWTLEEPPHFALPTMGSAQHVAWLQAHGKRVVGAVAMDMVGYFTSERGTQRYPWPWLQHLYGTRGDFLGVVGNLGCIPFTRAVKRGFLGVGGLRVVSLNAPPWGVGLTESDHRNFWDVGWPAVMVTDTAFYRNARYHTPQDTPDTLDIPTMVKVTQGLILAVQALAGAGDSVPVADGEPEPAEGSA